MLQSYIKDVSVILKIALMLNRKITPKNIQQRKEWKVWEKVLKEKNLQFSRLSLPFRY